MPSQFDHDVFVSYASVDREVARKIVEFLQKERFQVWFDELRLNPSDIVKQKIITGMKASRHIVVCFSRHPSDWRIFEASDFLMRRVKDCRVIVVKLDDTELPALFGDLKYLDWRDPEVLSELRVACGQDTDVLMRRHFRSTQKARSLGHSAIAKKMAALDALKRGGSQPPIVLLGGIYLDLNVQPITQTVLTGDEYAHLEPIKMELGGSAIVVGQVLMKRFKGKRSHLVSVRSGMDDDLLAKQCQDLLKREEAWIIEPKYIHKASLAPATTVILHQSSGSFNTMFTHRGALEELTWDRFNDVREALGTRGILYISAFFKTKLWMQFADNLAALDDSIIVMDHGRLMPGLDNNNAVQALKRAFQERLIDVYICTLRELWDFISLIDGIQREPPDDTKSALEQIAKRNILPHVTYVRSRRVHPKTKAEVYEAYCIIGNEVNQLRSEAFAASPFSAVRPGAVAKNIFNAAILYSVASDLFAGNIQERFIEAGQAALQECQAPD